MGIFIGGGISSDIRSEITFFSDRISDDIPLQMKFWVHLSPKCKNTSFQRYTSILKITTIRRLVFAYVARVDKKLSTTMNVLQLYKGLEIL